MKNKSSIVVFTHICNKNYLVQQRPLILSIEMRKVIWYLRLTMESKTYRLNASSVLRNIESEILRGINSWPRFTLVVNTIDDFAAKKYYPSNKGIRPSCTLCYNILEEYDQHFYLYNSITYRFYQ